MRPRQRLSCSDEGLLGRVAVGPHPNGLAYDRASRRLYSFNLGEPLGENCSASVIDVGGLEVVAELPLPGRPRWAVYDEERQVVYANIRDPSVIVIVDCGRVEIARVFEVPSDGPHGLWLDGARLLCAADGGNLIALDRDTGSVLQSLPLPGSPMSSGTTASFGGSTLRSASPAWSAPSRPMET